MNLNKELSLIGIEPTRSLTNKEVNKIVKKFVQALINNFPEQNINVEKAISKMYYCQMYFAKFPDNLGTANYFYKNKTIYFKEGINIENLDDYMLHELIHYFQDTRNKNGNLIKLGICNFSQYKIHGMAMNEAAIQYIVSKILHHRREKIEYCGITIKTISKKYYPLLTSLITQIAYLVDKHSLIKSTIFSTDEFLESLMDIIGEGQTKEIQDGFDNLLQAKQKLYTIQDIQIIKEQEEKVKQIYEMLQKQIMTTYFDEMLKLIENIKEAEEYKNKLKGYEKLLGNSDEIEFYQEYKEKQLEKTDKKIIEISRRNSKNMLMVINNNKFFSIFKLIQKIFYTKKEQYKN